MYLEHVNGINNKCLLSCRHTLRLPFKHYLTVTIQKLPFNLFDSFRLSLEKKKEKQRTSCVYARLYVCVRSKQEKKKQESGNEKKSLEYNGLSWIIVHHLWRSYYYYLNKMYLKH